VNLRLRLEEVDLQVGLEVQVRHLILVRNAEELAQRGVREDAALERRVKAVVLLDITRDELGHLRLRALLARLETHERRELIRQRALDEEGVVRTARLVGLQLLSRHVLRVLALLALAIAGLALGGLDGGLNTVDRLAELGRQRRAEGLELLAEGGELDIRRLRGLNHDRGGGRLNRRDGDGGGRGDLLGLGLGGGLGLRGLGDDRCRGSGDRGGGRSRLLRGHLV
jgi:hypothetical protein